MDGKYQIGAHSSFKEPRPTCMMEPIYDTIYQSLSNPLGTKMVAPHDPDGSIYLVFYYSIYRFQDLPDVNLIQPESKD